MSAGRRNGIEMNKGGKIYVGGKRNREVENRGEKYARETDRHDKDVSE